jgi:hypothetical protein
VEGLEETEETYCKGDKEEEKEKKVVSKYM